MGVEVPHAMLLGDVKKHIDGILRQSSYNNVDLTKLFAFMGKT